MQHVRKTMRTTNKKTRQVVDGVLLLDKPEWMSSNDALIKVKRLYHAQKAGHTGTLDPFATGLLPLCFGQATKFSQDLLEADKIYEAKLHLGLTTTTGDTEGVEVQVREVNASEEQIQTVLTQFLGEVTQIPPMYSALKHEGRALYHYAREGITIERPARLIFIHEIDFLSYENPYLRIRVRCSKGTYMRVLSEDIGVALGCGAHLSQLKRVGVGNLTLMNAVTLDALVEATQEERMDFLAPVDALLSSFPSIMLDDALADRFLHGQRLNLAKALLDIGVKAGRVRVYRENDNSLLGTAEVVSGILAPERLVATA